MSGAPVPKPCYSCFLALLRWSLSCPWDARVDTVLPVMLHRYWVAKQNHFPGSVLSSSTVPHRQSAVAATTMQWWLVVTHLSTRTTVPFLQSCLLASQPLASIIDCSLPSSELRFCSTVFCQLSRLVTSLRMTALPSGVAQKLVHPIWCYPWTGWGCMLCHGLGCTYK